MEAAKTSRRIEDLHKDLAKIFIEAEKQWEGAGNANVIITCTHRNNAMQMQLYAQGRTTKGGIVTWAKAGQSPHNYLPALAFDVAFLKPDGKSLDWGKNNFVQFAKVCKKVADQFDIQLIWGGDWDDDGTIDRKKTDLPHFQLNNWRTLI
jgi:peptidoglycan L-alanyl-D-glutamate endopeptidase CwlK